MDPSNPLITITTISGEKVTAPLVQWVQALILELPPDRLLKLMAFIERANAPLITIPRDTVPVDPQEWLSGNGRRT